MEYPEDDFLMISGIQHFAFCRRQWALINIEQQWDDNIHTAEGTIMHKRAHDVNLVGKTKDCIIVRGLPVHSRKFGISGECDVVEFHRAEDGVQLHGHRGLFQISPVEYKKGHPKVTQVDVLQLVAQIVCLEEMFSTEINFGYLYYGETRRREQVAVTEEIRIQLEAMLQEMHQIYRRGTTPQVKWSKSCNACSLKDICIPKLGKKNNVRAYIDRAISEDTG